MFEENEILTFILGIVAVAIVFPITRKIELPGILPFRIGVVSLALTYFFTNVEAIAMSKWSNLLEHFFFAAAGLSFFVAIRLFSKGEKST